MIVAVHLVLGAEFVLILDYIISSKVNTRLHVTDQDWLVRWHYLALLLESIIGVKRVNDPDAIVVQWSTRSARNLLLGDRCFDRCCVLVTA